MKTSILGISLIKRFESLKLEAYLCPAGVWTIGYGHTNNVFKGDKCTEAQADKWLVEDAMLCEIVINRLAPKLNQNQFDALVSFGFNVGIDAMRNSTLINKVRINPKDKSIYDEFLRWVKADGTHNGKDDDGDGFIDEAGEKQRLAGLIKRRTAEADLYFMQ